MTIFRALATVVGTAIGFGVAGTGIGVFLGTCSPDFFRVVMPPLRGVSNFDPLGLGIGLGLVNGLCWGMVIGVVLVAILSWKETRMPRKDRPGSEEP